MNPSRDDRAWYRIENRAGTNGPAELYLYDEIGAWGLSAGDFVKDLRDVTASTIDLHINSPGGDVFDGIAIYNALRNHRAAVNVTVDGIAASAASFISQAGDKIVMARNAQMMIHEGHGVCVGNSKDMAAMTDLLDKCSDNIADIYAQRAGGTVADWRNRMRAETWYTAAEAVKAGLADEIATSSTGATNSWDLSIFNFAGRDAAPDPFSPTAAAMPMKPTKPMTPDMPPEPMPEHHMFAAGDRVQVVGTPHEPGQTTGTVAVVEMGPAYGIRFDGGGDPGGDEMDDVHRWYVGPELAPSSSSPPAAVARSAAVAAVFDPAVCECPNCGPPQPLIAEGDWNPEHFRNLMQAVATDVPAVPPLPPRPVDLGPAPPPPEPVPEPPPASVWDQVRAAVRIAANDAPAPPQPNTTQDPAQEPGFFMDASAFTTALRRAKL